MTTADYKNLIKPVLKLLAPETRKIFLKIVNSSTRLVSSSNNVCHHIEASVSPQDYNSIIKIIHIFRYSVMGTKYSAGHFISGAYLLELVRELNEKLRLDFNLELLKSILCVPVMSGSGNDIIAFYIEYDYKIKKFIKMSFHFNPEKTSWFLRILSMVKRKNAKNKFKGLVSEKIEFLGVDLFPNSDFNFKIYLKVKRIDKGLSLLSLNSMKILGDLNRLYLNQSLLLMHRFNSVGELLKPSALYMYHGESLDYRKLLNAQSLKKYGRFMRKFPAYFEKFNLIWTAVKGDQLEFYFR